MRRGDKLPHIHYLWGRCGVPHPKVSPPSHPNSKRDHSQVQSSSLKKPIMTPKTLFSSLCLILLCAFACTKDRDIETVAEPESAPSTEQLPEEVKEDIVYLQSAQLAPLRVSYNQPNAKSLALDPKSARAEALAKLSDRLLTMLPQHVDPAKGNTAFILICDDEIKREIYVQEFGIYASLKDQFGVLVSLLLLDRDLFGPVPDTEPTEPPHKLQIICDGGKTDDRSVLLDPRGSQQSLAFAKGKIASLLTERLATGEGLRTHKATLLCLPAY